MSVNDLIAEEDEAKAHEYAFYLWPRLWREYVERSGHILNWEERQFLASKVSTIPDEPGLYTFLVQPSIAGHPSNSYLMYVGKTRRTLRQRFREYVNEMRRERGRPKIVRLLNKYHSHTVFCYSIVNGDAATLAQMERALIGALVPPCNMDQLPARVRRIVGALR